MVDIIKVEQWEYKNILLQYNCYPLTEKNINKAFSYIEASRDLRLVAVIYAIGKEKGHKWQLPENLIKKLGEVLNNNQCEQLIKLGIKHEEYKCFELLLHKGSPSDEEYFYSTILKSIKFVDSLFNQEIKQEELDQIIAEILPISTKDNKIPSEFYGDIIERIEFYRQDNKGLSHSFYKNWQIVKDKLPQDLVTEINKEIFTEQKQSSTDIDEETIKVLFMHEGAIISQAYSVYDVDGKPLVSTTSIFHLLNQQDSWGERWGSKKVKDETLKVWKWIYKEVPEISMILEELNKESPDITEELKKICNKALINYIGYAYYKILNIELFNPTEGFELQNVERLQTLIKTLHESIRNTFDEKCKIYQEHRAAVDLIVEKTAVCFEYVNHKIAEQDQQIAAKDQKIDELENKVSYLEQQMLSMQESFSNQLQQLYTQLNLIGHTPMDSHDATDVPMQ